MTGELTTLTTYFGERARAGNALLADRLFALYGTERVAHSAMLRGIEGFGHERGAHTDRLLTLSEDLPVVSVAVDTAERIDALLPRVLALQAPGLVTLERARPLGGPLPAASGSLLPADLTTQAKLSVFLGRGERIGGRPAFLAVCDLLHRCGAYGATVLLGVDGTRSGRRTRAALLARNREVPVIVVGVGRGAAIADAADALVTMLGQPAVTLERVQLLRRDGRALAELEPQPPVREHDTRWAQKLTVHSSEEDRVGGHPLHRVLIQRLRRARLAGATTLRGVYGFHGGAPARGDRLRQVRRHGPVMTVAVDDPERIAEVFAAVAEVTAERGLVTAETVPVRLRAQRSGG